ncbi:hypothetical protein DRQ32_08500 [bacterium]|nr:MAG: hypothetical protein DRQ32_08500 [bacterium]
MAQTSLVAYLGTSDGLAGARLALFVRQTSYPTTWTKLGEYDAGKVDIPKMFIGTGYEFAAALVDEDGNCAPETDWATHKITPVGSTLDALPAVTNLGVTQDGEYVEAVWDDVSANCPHFSGYEVRVGSSWVDARYVGRSGKSAGLRWKWETAKAIVARVRTKDVYGKQSAELTQGVTVVSLENFVDGAEQDEDTGGFLAVKDGTDVDSGKLQYTRWGNPANTITQQADTWTFLGGGPAFGTYEADEVDLGSVRHIRMEMDLDLETDGDHADRMAEDWTLHPVCAGEDPETGIAVDVSDPNAVIEQGRIIANGDTTAPDVRVFIKYDDTDTNAAEYQPYIPGWFKARYYRIKLVIYSWDRWRRPRISKLRFIERKKNLKDEGTIVISGAGPTAETYGQTFIDEPYVVARASDAANRVDISSLGVGGFSATVYDPHGDEVTTGSVYWIAVGT